MASNCISFESGISHSFCVYVCFTPTFMRFKNKKVNQQLSKHFTRIKIYTYESSRSKCKVNFKFNQKSLLRLTAKCINICHRQQTQIPEKEKKKKKRKRKKKQIPNDKIVCSLDSVQNVSKSLKTFYAPIQKMFKV